MTPSPREQLQALLAEEDRFEALALVSIETDRLLFLGGQPSTPPEMLAAVEELLLRAVTNTEALERLNDGDEVLYYDLEGRQVIFYLLKTKQARWLFLAIVSPGKAYKQITKRLLKTLKSAL